MPAPADPPTLADVPLAPPFFLRQLRPGGAWGDPATPFDDRLGAAVRAVFLNDELPYSLWRVETPDDYRRAALALYAGRERPAGNLDLLPISPGELADAGGACPRTDGVTLCDLANRALHHDWAATPDQVRGLCEWLMRGGRARVRLRERPLLVWHAESVAEGCRIGGTAGPCRAPACLALTTAPPGV